MLVVVWTEKALKRLGQIKSSHFTDQETEQYKIELLLRVEERVSIMGTSMPSHEYKNTFYCIVDNYIVSYKLSRDHTKCVISSIKHTAMKRIFKY